MLGGFILVLGLLVEILLLRARLAGYREAREQMANAPGPNRGPFDGVVKTLAIIGLIALCFLCLLIGIALAELG